MAKTTPKARKRRAAEQRVTSDARAAVVHGWTLWLGYAIVAFSVIAGFVMSFRPQVFGMSSSNPAIGFGLAALAGFRLYALRRELQRQEGSAER